MYYKTGVRSTIAGFCLGILFLGILFSYYVLENRRRTRHCDREPEEGTEQETPETFINKTDKEDPGLRYVF